MENLTLIYFLKVSISITFFYGLYILLLRNDTLFKLKRFYLLFSIIFSIIFPFVNFDILSQGTMQIPEYLLFDIIITPNQLPYNINDLSPSIIILIISVSVSFLLLCKFIFQIFSLIMLRYNNDTEDIDGHTIIRIKNNKNSSFSFFNWIFLNGKDNAPNTIEIITHEKVHVNQYHSIDVIVSEVLCIALWWNPFIWLLRSEIKKNLEYLADQGTLDNGVSTRQYQYALLQESYNESRPLINNFNVSQLKKRITMMNKKRTSMLASIKYLLIIPIVGGLLMINCTRNNTKDKQASIEHADYNEVDSSVEELKKTKTEPTAKPFTTVEEMPSFPGGEKALMDYISENLKYPTVAQEAGIQGRVIIRFVVDNDGSISNVNILRGIDPACDNEAVRVVEAMPKWKPGKQRGKPVSVYFTLPIVFRLNE